MIDVNDHADTLVTGRLLTDRRTPLDRILEQLQHLALLAIIMNAATDRIDQSRALVLGIDQNRTTISAAVGLTTLACIVC